MFRANNNSGAQSTGNIDGNDDFVVPLIEDDDEQSSAEIVAVIGVCKQPYRHRQTAIADHVCLPVEDFVVSDHRVSGLMEIVVNVIDGLHRQCDSTSTFNQVFLIAVSSQSL